MPLLSVISVVLSLFAWVPQATPQPLSGERPGSRKLTLEQALELAEQQHPRLKAASAGIEAAQAGILTARAWRNPDITAGGFGGQRATQVSAIPGMITGLVVSQPLDLPSVRSARIQAAQLGREASTFSLAETRLAVRGAVKQAFYQVLRRKAELELTAGNLQLLEDLQRRIRVQVQVGEAARLELVRADAEVATARIQQQSARLRLNTALAVLHAAVGVPRSENFDPEDRLDTLRTLPPLEELRRDVVDNHPSISAAETETRRAGARLNLEKALVKPQPTVWADVFQQPDAAQYRVGVTLPVPLWNKREGPIAEAVAAQRQAAAWTELRRLELTTALESAYGQYEVATRQLEEFEAGTLRSAEAAVKAAEAAFRFGERGIIEVLDAQRVLRGARSDYLNAQYDRQAALVELEQLGAVDLRKGRP